jgi:Flp pilus assembly protein TadG
VRIRGGPLIPQLRDDRGSSVVEFSMVSVLLIALLLGVLQVAALFYVRSVIAASAADGARWAANADVGPQQGAARATELIEGALSTSIADDVPCEGTTETDDATGLPLIQVRCVGQIRSLLLPIGALIDIDVRSRSLREGVG